MWFAVAAKRSERKGEGFLADRGEVAFMVSVEMEGVGTAMLRLSSGAWRPGGGRGFHECPVRPSAPSTWRFKVWR